MSLTASPPRPAPAALGTAGLLVLLSATFVATLDFFVVNVALPTMRAELGAAAGLRTAWVAGYGAAFAGFLVLGARLGDGIGRCRAFVLGMGGFTLASAACGLAPTGGVLLVCRVAQGLTAAVAAPQVLATIGAGPAGAGRERAIGLYGLVAGLAAIAGQLVGGALIELDLAGLGWRWCFFVNVPVGLVAVSLAGRVVPETRAARPPRVDRASALALPVGLCLLVILLSVGPDLGWSAAWAAGTVLAADLLVAFAARQLLLARRGRSPLVDLGLLRERSFGLGVLLVLVLQLGVGSAFLVLALALQGGAGVGPLQAGLVFTVLAVGYVATSVAAPALLGRHGPRVLVAGAVLAVVGQALLATGAGAMSPGASLVALVPGLLVAGVGLGLLFGPSVSVALTRLAPERAGEGSGIVNTIQQLGGALGVALLGTVFASALRAGGVVHAFAVGSWCLVGVMATVGLLALALRR